jgi:isocitrate/isopropylmalate dehydrogenase
MTASSTLISIAYGDGIGHEVMEAAFLVMREAGAQLEIEVIQIGGRVYGMGSSNGVLPSSWESLERTRVLLKGPVSRPENKKHITEMLCGHFDLDVGLRFSEHCDDHPEISAVAYVNDHFALFEPLQDALPEIAGKNKAHPGAMILASAMMLQYIGQKDIADNIRAALQEALKNHKRKIKTRKFAESVVEHLLAVTALAG